VLFDWLLGANTQQSRNRKLRSLGGPAHSLHVDVEKSPSHHLSQTEIGGHCLEERAEGCTYKTARERDDER
jgi:hypothetical protein